jgi:hypothetical protein
LEAERRRGQLNSKELRWICTVTATLSWSRRRELARRVVEQDWTLTAAAETAGVSVRVVSSRDNGLRSEPFGSATP